MPFPFTLNILSGPNKLQEAFLDAFEESLRKRIFATSPRPIGLASGETMRPIYKGLILRLQKWPREDFEKLRSGWLSFNLDEYVGLAKSDKRSFSDFMFCSLGKPLGLAPNQLNLPNGSCEDPEEEAIRYSEEISRFGGIGIQLLGIGLNGHIGFNEPPCGLDASCREVFLSEATRKQNSIHFKDEPNLVPTKAITLGMKEILESEEIHLIVSGSRKARILASLIHSECTDLLPASWLKTHKRVFLWADHEASMQVEINN